MCFFDIYLSPIVITTLRECACANAWACFDYYDRTLLAAEPFCLHQFELHFYTPIKFCGIKSQIATLTHPTHFAFNPFVVKFACVFFDLAHSNLLSTHPHWTRVNYTQTKIIIDHRQTLINTIDLYFIARLLFVCYVQLVLF